MKPSGLCGANPTVKEETNNKWLRDLLRDVLIHSPRNPADRWKNCAFYETSMKFSTQVDFAFMVIFSYRGISDFSKKKKMVAVFTLFLG